MNHFNLKLLYQETPCVLDFNYLLEAHTFSCFAYSRSICIQAAMDILRHQSMIYEACQVRGANCAWSSGTWLRSQHDFLLAAIIICLELNSNHKVEPELIGDYHTRPA